MKVAIYTRVSTDHQIDKDSLPMQRKDLIAYSQLIIGTDDYEIFEDAGYSGKNIARPGFQVMMERVRKKEFTHVLVWKIDRISRNLLDFAQMYAELKKLGVAFVSKNSIDAILSLLRSKPDSELYSIDNKVVATDKKRTISEVRI